MNVLITLDSNIGADLGPFTLSANVGNVVPSTATRTELINGLQVTVDNTATQITITSDPNGLCGGSILTLDIDSIPEQISNVSYILTTNDFGQGSYDIDYTPGPIILIGHSENINEVSSGDFSATIGTEISINISNLSFNLFSTNLTIRKDGIIIFEQSLPGNEGAFIGTTFTVVSGSSYTISASIVGDDPSEGLD